MLSTYPLDDELKNFFCPRIIFEITFFQFLYNCKVIVQITVCNIFNLCSSRKTIKTQHLRSFHVVSPIITFHLILCQLPFSKFLACNESLTINLKYIRLVVESTFLTLRDLYESNRRTQTGKH